MTTTERDLYDKFVQYDIAVDGQRVHIVDVGRGPAVVMVHGSPVSSFTFRHQINALKDDFRVIAPDLLSFGRSSAPPAGAGFRLQADMLHALIGQLGLDEFDLVMHDWGGPIAYAAVGRWVQQVRRLVFMNTSVRPDFLPPPYWRIFVGPLLGELVTVRFNATKHVLPSLMRAARSREIREIYAGPLDRPATRRTVLALERLDGFAELMTEASTVWTDHKPPVLFLWGHPDPYFRKGELERMCSMFPDAALHTIPGGGHFPQEDTPQKITDALLGFLR